MKVYQPHTTDSTSDGLRRARNAMRIKLWADDSFAHRWMCHPDRECEDGCDTRADPARAALYQSEMERRGRIGDGPTKLCDIHAADLTLLKELAADLVRWSERYGNEPMSAAAELDCDGDPIQPGKELETVHLSDMELYSKAGFHATFVHEASAWHTGLHVIVGDLLYVPTYEEDDGRPQDGQSDEKFCSMNSGEFAWFDPACVGMERIGLHQDGLVSMFKRQ